MGTPLVSNCSSDLTPGIALVGVGPGDPSLLTLRAVQKIEQSTLVAYPVSRLDREGMAANIASTWISNEKKRLPLLFPMVKEVESLKQAWIDASDQLADAVFNGERVVFLCQGDVSLFASSSYVLLGLKARYPECPVELVPGVTAISAAAAAAAWPLTIQQDQLLVLPTPDDSKTLEILLADAFRWKRVIALMKLGHRWTWVKPLLARKNLLDDALFAQKVGWPDQKIIKAIDLDETVQSYFSLLLIRQSWPEIIP